MVVVCATGVPVSGVLHSLKPGETCYGRISPIHPSDPYITVGECLLAEDVGAGEFRPPT
jgi:hypothetical protein